MKVMVIVKADADSEAGVLPSQEMLTQMGKFNEDLVKAGVMLAGEGLQPSRNGVRVRFDQAAPSVVYGPFEHPRELAAGFWLWQVRSVDEAIEWIRRSPFRTFGGEIEIRPIFEPEDFGDHLTPELREQEARLRARIATH